MGFKWRVGRILAVTICLSACRGLGPWQTGEDGLRMSMGNSTLGEGVEIKCVLKQDPQCGAAAVSIFLKPVCTPTSPLHFDVEVESPRGTAFTISEHFPYALPAELTWNRADPPEIALPLLFPPEAKSRVWAKVSATCDDRKTHIEGAVICTVRQ